MVRRRDDLKLEANIFRQSVRFQAKYRSKNDANLIPVPLRDCILFAIKSYIRSDTYAKQPECYRYSFLTDAGSDNTRFPPPSLPPLSGLSLTRSFFFSVPFIPVFAILHKKGNLNKNAKALRPNLVIYFFRLSPLSNQKLRSECTKNTQCNQLVKINKCKHFVFIFSTFRFGQQFWIKNANFSQPFWIVISKLKSWKSHLDLVFSKIFFYNKFQENPIKFVAMTVPSIFQIIWAP